MPTTPGSAPETPLEAEVEQHEQEVEDKEAYEYWGFMFKADKTGTDRLKALLRGLKDVMVSEGVLDILVGCRTRADLARSRMSATSPAITRTSPPSNWRTSTASCTATTTSYSWAPQVRASPSSTSRWDVCTVYSRCLTRRLSRIPPCPRSRPRAGSCGRPFSSYSAQTSTPAS